MKRKVYITMYKSFQMMALYEDERLVELYADSSEEQSILDRIYIGKVKNIVKNINAAFIDIGSVEGYYSLKENPLPFYTNGKEAHAAMMPGDEVLVQVCRENIKTKAPALTSKISLAGKYIVLELDAGKSMSASVDKNNLVRQISVSSKIKDKNEHQRLKSIFLSMISPNFKVIIRTKAAGMAETVLKEEWQQLSEKMQTILDKSRFLTCYSEVYKEPADYIKRLRNLEDEDMEKIVTDIPEVYDALKSYSIGQTLSKGLVLYQDETMPLIKLLSLETHIERALLSQVWLKSGGSLVINVTEALTVIDVNTGRYVGKKTQEDTFFKINMDAAREIARQLRLRNLSGIILIDFIDMKSKEMRKMLMDELVKETSKDPVKTVVVDMTKLNLVEMTRKKERKPLHEQMLTQCPCCHGLGYVW